MYLAMAKKTEENSFNNETKTRSEWKIPNKRIYYYAGVRLWIRSVMCPRYQQNQDEGRQICTELWQLNSVSLKGKSKKNK